MRWRLILSILMATAIGGCGDDSRASSGLVIDERAGKVDGVGLGDSAREIRRAFGGEIDAGALLPTSEVGLPWIVEPPRDRRGRPTVIAYRDLNFLTAPGSGVYTMSIWRDGSATKRGIRLGDPLSRARELYRGLRCGTRNEKSEYEPYPYCRGRVGSHWIWFGRDPIRSITISSTPLG